ncbi:MAG: arylsulfatase [Planctomycetes bacterium]|nr:arylsulfatase [Planctomycetota bacterium]
MKSPKRRDFLKWCAAGAAAVSAARAQRTARAAPAPAAAASGSPLAGRRPNIILIMTDDQGYGDLACTGNPVIKTPNIDRLYGEAVRFTDFHVSPTCSPTRASLMAGRHEFKSGVTHTILERERLSPKAVTFPQLLTAAGYATGIFGKWHLGDEADRRPDKRGFQETFIHGAGGIGQTYAGSCGDAPGNRYFDPVILHNGVFEKTQGYCTDVFFAQAARWIEERKGKQPFFAEITPNAPHGPLVCPEQYEKMYADKVDANVAKFYGMITNIDENVGRLLAKLKEWAIEKDTLVIFMTDNGSATGSRVYNAGMRGAKGSAHNGGTRVPAFWRWPAALRPGDRGQLAAHLDIFPTLAELAGAAVPDEVRAGLDGFSLLPVLADAAASWPDRCLVTHVGRWARGKAAESKYANCSIRRGPYLMVSRGGPNAWDLYDLKSDPGQAKDIAAQHPDVVKELAAIYDKWWADVLPCLENEDAVGPAVNPFKELYWKQYGGPGPNNAPPGEGQDEPAPPKKAKAARKA